MMEGPCADSEEKHEPVSDIDTAFADSLKVLDLKRPIREADPLCSTRAFPSDPDLISSMPPSTRDPDDVWPHFCLLTFCFLVALSIDDHDFAEPSAGEFAPCVENADAVGPRKNR